MAVQGTVTFDTYSALDSLSATNWNGYICAFTPSVAGVIVSRIVFDPSLDGGAQLESQTTLPLPGGVTLWSNPGRPWVVPLQAPTDSGASALFGFFPVALGADARAVYCVTPDNELMQVGGSPPPACLTWSGSVVFAIASNNDGVTIATREFGARGGSIRVVFVPWADLATGANAVEATIPIADSVADLATMSIGGIYTLAPPDPNLANAQLHLVLAMFYTGSDGTAGVLFCECPTSSEQGTLLAEGQATFSVYPMGSADEAIGTALSMGEDGRVYLVAKVYPSSGPFTLLRRTAPGTWVDLGTPDVAKDTVELPAVSYTWAAGTGGVTPVTRLFLTPWTGDGACGIHYTGDDFGTLRRTPLDEVPGQKALLLGIMVGPPPVPVENINIANEPYLMTSGSTSFSTSKSASATFRLNLRAGMVVEYRESVGSVVKETASLNMSAGYEYSYDDEVKTTITKTYTINLLLKQDPATKKYYVAPYGQVVLLTMGLMGYSYQYYDPSGATSPDAPTFTQIYPTGIEIDMRPFVLNPEYYPVPGDLMSYAVPPETLATWTASATSTVDAAGQASPALFTSWSTAGEETETWQRYEATSVKQGFYFDLKAMMGESFNDYFAHASLSMGVQFKMDASVTYGDSDTIGLSTKVQTKGDLSIPGTYAAYDYLTFQLAPSNAATNTLLQSLVTDDFPADPTARASNQQIKDLIAVPVHDDGGSVVGPEPWTICYALASYERVHSIDDAAAQVGAALPEALSAKLREARIGTNVALREALSRGTAPALDAPELCLARRLAEVGRWRRRPSEAARACSPERTER